ncbi:hypothetical protein [Anabaena sp. CCY 0017]|uniref:hypothetical protein n=1 Tax=Anabaena sp. CCY 0017 TaxID=3103866 RepID=UPI0039C6483D
MANNIEKILNNSLLSVDEKVEKTTKELNVLSDRGVAEAIELILNINDPAKATYPANYLALLPNLKQEKKQVVEQIINDKKDLLIAVTNLVKDLPDDVINKLITEYFQDPESSDLYNIIFEVAQFFPEKLQPFASQIDDEYLQELILPGGSDSWVNDLVNNYGEDEDPEHLKALAYFRTDKALDALITLSKTIPEEYLADVYAYIESSGVFADSRLASVYFKNYRGYVVSRDESPHYMGGSFPYPVPKCPVTDTPANRILTLDISQLDLDLKSSYNPSFFWYESGYSPGCIYVQFTENGIKGLITPMTDGEVGTDLIPGELALKLEEYPLKYGRGGTATSGFSNHQVGGYPNWINFERFPRCPVCGQGMKFLVSIDSGMTPFGKFGFNGILYGFWCDPCAVSCTYHQSDEDDFE